MKGCPSILETTPVKIANFTTHNQLLTVSTILTFALLSIRSLTISGRLALHAYIKLVFPSWINMVTTWKLIFDETYSTPIVNIGVFFYQHYSNFLETLIWRIHKSSFLFLIWFETGTDNQWTMIKNGWKIVHYPLHQARRFCQEEISQDLCGCLWLRKSRLFFHAKKKWLSENWSSI